MFKESPYQFGRKFGEKIDRTDPDELGYPQLAEDLQTYLGHSKKERIGLEKSLTELGVPDVRNSRLDASDRIRILDRRIKKAERVLTSSGISLESENS